MPKPKPSYQPIVKQGMALSHWQGWHEEGPSFPTLKGAKTGRARLARKYFRCHTGIRAPSGDIADFTRALNPTAAAPPEPKIKKRRVVPRQP